jgi:hypothetical protein
MRLLLINPTIAARFVVPLNIGYRRRHRALGTFANGRTFRVA